MSPFQSLSTSLLNTISVPKDLDSVETWDPTTECDPKDVGMTAAQADELWENIRRFYRCGSHPGMTICMRKSGRVILNRAIGHARGNGPLDGPEVQKTLIDTHTPIGLFSASKAITAMLMHLLAEKGLIDLHEPVSSYIPEFGRHKKDKITTYHLLAHQAGIPNALNGLSLESWLDHQTVLEHLCDAKLKYPVGKPLQYHAVSSGHLFAEIVQRVTGRHIDALLKEMIVEPLGLHSMAYGITNENLDQVALNYSTGISDTFPLTAYTNRAFGFPMKEIVKLSNDPRFLQATIPSANIVASTQDTASFFELLLNGGTLNGVQVFKPETVHNAIRPIGSIGLDRILFLPMRYSAGMMLGNDRFGLLFGNGSGNAFGHLGFTNVLCWADPSRDISIAFLNTGKGLLGPHVTAAVSFMNLVSNVCPVLPVSERRR